MFVLTKSQAKSKADILNKFLAERGVTLASSDLLNAVARMAGLEDWNAMAAMYRPEAIDALLLNHEIQKARDSVDVTQAGAGFGPECQVQTASGFWMVMPAYPAPVDYVRVCDPLGREVGYWSIDEFTEDAGCVLPALCGILNRERGDMMPNPSRPSADKLVVTDRSGKKKASTGVSNFGELPWKQILSISICLVGADEADYYDLHNQSEFDNDIFDLIDSERNGETDLEDVAELDQLNDQNQIDWGDEFEQEGLSVKDLRMAVPGPGKAWTLAVGRILRFFRLTEV